MVVSCPRVAVTVVLVCPHFPSLRYMLCVISVWNDWSMASCYNGRGVVCPHISRLSEICSAYLPHDVLMFPFLRRVIHTTVQIRAQHFYQLKTVDRSAHLRAGHGKVICNIWMFWSKALTTIGRLTLTPNLALTQWVVACVPWLQNTYNVENRCRRKGSTRSERRKIKYGLGDTVAIVAKVYGVVCQLYLRP